MPHGTLFELKAEYKRHSRAISAKDGAEAKRMLMMLIRVVGSDHRYGQAQRLAYMAMLLEDHRELWYHA